MRKLIEKNRRYPSENRPCKQRKNENLFGRLWDNNLRFKDIEEVIVNLITNCSACNETGKVANIRKLLTPRSKEFNNSVAIDWLRKQWDH